MSGLSRELDDHSSSWNDAHIPTLRRHPKNHQRLETVASARHAAGAAADRVAHLTRTIESEIIPRLLLANRAAADGATQADVRGCGPDLDSEVVDQLAVAVVRGSLDAADAQVAALRRAGMSLETIFLNVLAPTARRLGDAWDADTLSFADVTIGLGNLQGLLRLLSPSFEGHRETSGSAKRILLLQAPGEQHSFGLFMVESFFRRAGWNVAGAAAMPIAEASALVKAEWIDVVGFSQSAPGLLDPLASAISALRRSSRNKAVSVLVGGPAFNGHPENVVLVGADATASDGRQAVMLANRCLQASVAR